MDTLQSMVKFSDKKSPYGLLNIQDETQLNKNTMNVINSQVNQFADMEEIRNEKMKLIKEQRLINQGSLPQSELDLTSNSDLSDGQLFDEDHMFLMDDPTTEIKEQDFSKMLEEQKNQRFRNIYKQNDKEYLLDQKLKNVLKVINAINQEGIINYNSVTNIDQSDQVTNLDHMSQTSGLRKMLNLRIKNSWNGLEVSRLSTNSLKDKSILDGLMFASKNQSQSEQNQMRSIGQTICKFSEDRSVKELGNLAQYLLQYKFFSHIKNTFSEETFLRIISKMYIQRAHKNCYLFDEGAIGTRYYILLNGQLDEEKATEVKLQGVNSESEFKDVIWVYLQYLYDNMEKIYWRRVPYANGIKKYLTLVAKETILLSRVQSGTVSKESKLNTVEGSLNKSKENLHNHSKVDITNPVQTHSPEILSRDGSKQEISEDILKNVEFPNVNVSFLKSPLRRTNQSDLSNVNKKLLQQSIQSEEADYLETISENNSIQTVKVLRKQIVKNSHVRISDELLDRLKNIHPIFDFTVCFLNTKVRQIPEQTSFVDFENLMNANPYSIFVQRQSYMTYVDAKEYNQVVKQAKIVEMQQKLKILKENKFFKALSSNKLQKLQYYAKRIRCQRDQPIYKENEGVDGLYLIINGAVKYSQHIETAIPIDAQTKNKWFKDEIIQQGINKKLLSRDVAIFEKNEIIGFEEIIGQFLANERLEKIRQDYKKKGDIFHISKAQQFSVADKKRYFTCVSYSHDTEVLFFNYESVQQIIRIHELKFITKMFTDRSEILNLAIDNLETIKNQMSGSAVSEQIQKVTNKEYILQTYEKINPSFKKDQTRSNQTSQRPSPVQTIDKQHMTFLDSSASPVPSMSQNNLKSMDITQFQNAHIIQQSSITQQAQSTSTYGSIVSQKGEKSVHNILTESNLDTKMYANIGKNMESIKILESNDDEIVSQNDISVDDVHIKKAFLDKTGDFIAHDYRNNNNLKSQNTSQELTQYMLKSENSLKKYLKHDIEEPFEVSNDYIQQNTPHKFNIMKQTTTNTSSLANSKFLKNEPMGMNPVFSQKGPIGVLNKNLSKGSVLPSLTSRNKQLTDFEDQAVKTMNYGVQQPSGWKVNNAYNKAKYGMESRNSSYSNVHQSSISNIMNTPQIHRKQFHPGNSSISKFKDLTHSARPQNSPKNKNLSMLNSNDSLTGIGQMVSHKSSFYASKTQLQSPRDLLSIQINTPTVIQQSTKNIFEVNKIKYQDQSSFMDQSQDEIREICTMKGKSYQQEIKTTDITDYQQNMLNKDSSSLYLKDTRTFLGLKKVAQTNTKRKVQLDRLELGQRGEFKVEQSDGTKILYQDNTEGMEQNDKKIVQSDAKLNLRLLGVFQKLDTDGFLNIDENGVQETAQEQSKRFKNNIEKNMIKNDELFKQLDQLENNNKKKRYQKKRKGFQTNAQKTHYFSNQSSLVRDSMNESTVDKIQQKQAFLSAQLSDSPAKFNRSQNRVMKGSVVRDSVVAKNEQNLKINVNFDSNTNLIELIQRQNEILVQMIGQEELNQYQNSLGLELMKQPLKQMEVLKKVINSLAEDSKSIKAKRDSLKINKQLLGGSIKNIQILNPPVKVNENKQMSHPRNSDIGTESALSPDPMQSDVDTDIRLNEDDQLIQQNEFQLNQQKLKLSTLFDMQKEIQELQSRFGITMNVSQTDLNRQSSIQKSITKYVAIEQHQISIDPSQSNGSHLEGAMMPEQTLKSKMLSQSKEFKPTDFEDNSRQRVQVLQDKFKSQKHVVGEKKLITVKQSPQTQSPTKSINTIKNTKRNSGNSSQLKMQDQSVVSFKDQRTGNDREESAATNPGQQSLSQIIGDAGQYTSVSIPQVENENKFDQKVQITFDDNEQRDKSKISKDVLINMSQVQMNDKYNKSPQFGHQFGHLNHTSNYTVFGSDPAYKIEEPQLLIASHGSIHTTDSDEDTSKKVANEGQNNLEFQTNARNSKELTSWGQNQKILQSNHYKIELKRSKHEKKHMAKYMSISSKNTEGLENINEILAEGQQDKSNKYSLFVQGNNKKQIKESQIIQQLGQLNQSNRGNVRTGRVFQSGNNKDLKFGSSEHSLQVKPIEALREMTQSFDGLTAFKNYKSNEETAKLIMKGQLNKAYILNQKNIKSLSLGQAPPKEVFKQNFVQQQQLAYQNMQILQNTQKVQARKNLKLSPGITKLKDKFSKNSENPSLGTTFDDFRKLDQHLSYQLQKSVPFSQRKLEYKGHRNLALEQIPLIVQNRQFEIVGTSSQKSGSSIKGFSNSHNVDSIFQGAKASQNTIAFATGQDEETSIQQTDQQNVTPFTNVARNSPLTQLNTRSAQVSPDQGSPDQGNL